MLSVIDAIRGRHSTRGSFDTSRPITPATQKLILEAAQWAPTPTNMQNFEIVVVDAKEKLDAIGRIPAEMSENYLRENYAQLSSSDIMLTAKKPGCWPAIFLPRGPIQKHGTLILTPGRSLALLPEPWEKHLCCS